MHEARLQVYGPLHHSSPVGVERRGRRRQSREEENKKLNARHYDENVVLKFVDSFDGIDDISVLADGSEKIKCFNVKKYRISMVDFISEHNSASITFHGIPQCVCGTGSGVSGLTPREGALRASDA